MDDDLKVWYKDENKRERHIEYQVSLLNAANQVVRNKYLYLEASLCYENGNLVPYFKIILQVLEQQSILETMNGGGIAWNDICIIGTNS